MRTPSSGRLAGDGFSTCFALPFSNWFDRDTQPEGVPVGGGESQIMKCWLIGWTTASGRDAENEELQCHQSLGMWLYLMQVQLQTGDRIRSHMIKFDQARKNMVDCQVRPADVTDYQIIAAMQEVPRERFLPDDRQVVAYADEDLVLATGAVVLAPRTFAKMLEVADVQSGATVLDVGCAFGYSTAVISKLAATVIGLAADAETVAQADANLKANAAENSVVLHRPLSNGDAEHGPYDNIFIQGAVEHVPDELLQQLRPDGGRLIAVVRDRGRSECRVATRAGEHVGWRAMFDAAAPQLQDFAAEPEFVL